MKELDKEQREYVRGLFEYFKQSVCGDYNDGSAVFECHYDYFDKFLKEKGLLEEEFEGGKWYKSESGIIAFYRMASQNYGIMDGLWNTKLNMRARSLWKEATPKEVEEVLIKEAKKRGFFDKRHSINSNIRPKVTELEYVPNWTSDGNQCLSDLYSRNVIWRSDNGWATIIEEEKTIEQRLEAIEKQLNIK